MKLLWNLPKDGLGYSSNGSMHAPVDYVKINDNTVRIFLYVSGSGLCAYDIKDTSISGVDNLFNEERRLSIKVYGNYVALSEQAQSAAVYNMTGSQVAFDKNTSSVKTDNLSAGLYVVKVVANGKLYTQKVIIK